MTVKRIKPGKYAVENGLRIIQMDGAWFIITDDYRKLHKCRTLTDAKAIVQYYPTHREIENALALRERKES